ncbi:MAG: hypothetical protein HYT88_01265 [Candidatus Omnitrophica bacterium]|nr:hypothetical protein [Candidatus Omnitrophota bacterium]MBI2173874.1 hypothetical protein [Candidatus Omnitrophota bacterium]
MAWIFKANWKQRKRGHLKGLVLGYLKRYGIEPKGYLHQVLEIDWEPALRYVACCVQSWPEHVGIRRKITHLAKAVRRGQGPLEEEKNTEVAYSADLLEFKALYALCCLMQYEFVGCDEEVGGTGPHSRKNCDLTVKIDGETLKIRVDAKRWSGDIRSRRVDKHYDPVPKSGNFSARWKIGKWLRKRAQEVSREKQAQILVVHLPDWEYRFSKRGLREYCDEILPGVLTWDTGEPIWCWRMKAPLREIVVVGPPGCWKIACAPAEVRLHETPCPELCATGSSRG